MAKIVRKKRRPTPLAYCVLLLLVSGLLYTFSSIYLRQYNVELMTSAQKAENEIVALEKEYEGLRVELEKLASKEKVVNVATDDGMEAKRENIVYINQND